MTSLPTPIDTALLHLRIEQWCETLTERHEARNPGRADVYDAEMLTRYIRVTVARPDGSGKSVHAFVDRLTGDVLKAAGWKAPAKGVRFNLLDDDSFDSLLERCDPFGGYLYKR